MKVKYWQILLVLALGALTGKLLVGKTQSKNIESVTTIPKFYIPDLSAYKLGKEEYKELFTDSTIFMWGSSELTSVDFVNPYNLMHNFFNKHLLAIGRGGTQSFAAFGFLVSHANYIKNKKVVVLVSPNWFCGDAGASGTHPSIFANYFDYDNYQPSFFDTSIQNLVNNYYEEHSNELNSFHSSKKFRLNQSFNLKSSITEFGNELSKQLLSNNTYKPINIVEKVNFTANHSNQISLFFDSLKSIESKKFAKQCTNNRLGINEEYYANYCINKLPFNLKPEEISKNRELKDFKALLQLLKVEKYEPLIVFLPVNPYAYKMDEFEKFKPSIDSLIHKYNFPYYNLFFADTTNYEKGICRDAMHTGPLGWIEINKKILQTFYNNESGISIPH